MTTTTASVARVFCSLTSSWDSSSGSWCSPSSCSSSSSSSPCVTKSTHRHVRRRATGTLCARRNGANTHCHMTVCRITCVISATVATGRCWRFDCDCLYSALYTTCTYIWLLLAIRVIDTVFSAFVSL